MTESSLNDEIKVIYPTFQLGFSPPLRMSSNNERIYSYQWCSC